MKPRSLPVSTSAACRLLDRAIATIVEMRTQIGIVPIIGRDALIYPRTVAAGALKVSPEELRHGLLHAAEMVRDLYIVLDSEASIEIKVPSEAELGQEHRDPLKGHQNLRRLTHLDVAG